MNPDKKSGAPALHVIAGKEPLIQINGQNLILDQINLLVPDAASLLEETAEEERIEVLRRILELGAQSYMSLQANATMQMVEAELKGLSGEFSNNLEALLVKGQNVSEQQLQRLFQQHQNTMSTALMRYLDAESATSIPAMVGKTFQQHQQEFMRQMTAMLEDGEMGVLARMEGRISDMVSTNTDRVLTQFAARQALATKSNLSGRPYEGAVEAKLSEFARPTDDIVENCGDRQGILRRKSGDILVTLDINTTRGLSDARVVIECKKRGESASSFSVNEIRESLKMAKKNREAAAGVFVAESADILPNHVGFLKVSPTDFAVAYSPDNGDDVALAVAFKLARDLAIRAVAPQKEDVVDTAAAAAMVEEIRSRMEAFTQISSQHQFARNAIDKASGMADEMRSTIFTQLHKLDTLLQGSSETDNSE